MEVSTHAVHSEPNQCNFFPAPIESPIGVSLRLPFTVLCARHIVEHTLCGECSEPDTVTELMTDTNDLMLVHVEAVVGVVVARKQLFEREGVGELIHAAFRPVQLNAGHSLLEYRRVRRETAARLRASYATRRPGLKFCKLA